MAERIKRISGTLATVAIAIALLSPLGALPLFQTGYWNLVDSSYLAVLICVFLLLGALVIGSFGSFQDPLTTSPQVPTSGKLLFILGGIGAIAALGANAPLVALIGTYQSGYGPLWHIITALMVVAVSDLSRYKWPIRVMAATSTLVMLSLSVILSYTNLTSHTILIPSSDSYGLIGFFMLFFSGFDHTRWGILQMWALRLSAVFLIIISQNLTLIFLLGFGMIVVGVLWAVSRSRYKFKGSLNNIPNSIIVCLILAAVLLPFGLIFSEVPQMAGATLRMRAVIADIMAGAMVHSNAYEWILGHGWGQTQTAFYQFLHWSDMVVYLKQGDFLWRDMFHSHNFILETLYSTGVIGLIGLLGFLISIYFGAPVNKRFAALAFVLGYSLYSSVWYELSFHAPFLALALSSFTGLEENAKKQGGRKNAKKLDVLKIAPRVKWSIVTLSSASMLVLGVLIVSIGGFSHQVFKLRPDNQSLERQVFSTSKFPDDPRGSDFVRSMLYRDVLRHFEQHKELQTTSGVAVLEDILEDVSKRAATSRSPELLLIGLDLFNNISFLPEWEWAASALTGREGVWNDLALRSVELAPYRSDVLIPYLTYLLKNEQFGKLEWLVQQIELKNPHDSVGLYYLGAMLSQSPNVSTKQKGLLSIAAALDCGVEKFVEIPAWLEQGVQPYHRENTSCPVDGGVRNK